MFIPNTPLRVTMEDNTPDGGEAPENQERDFSSRKRRKQKPKDFPKRPLSAYNIFFKETREKIIAEKREKEGKNARVDFQSLAKHIATKWKALAPPEKERVEMLAKQDLQRYRDEIGDYEVEMVKKSRKEREERRMEKQPPSDTETNLAPNQLPAGLASGAPERVATNLAPESSGDPPAPSPRYASLNTSGGAIRRLPDLYEREPTTVEERDVMQRMLAQELGAVDRRIDELKRATNHGEQKVGHDSPDVGAEEQPLSQAASLHRALPCPTAAAAAASPEPSPVGRTVEQDLTNPQLFISGHHPFQVLPAAGVLGTGFFPQLHPGVAMPPNFDPSMSSLPGLPSPALHYFPSIATSMPLASRQRLQPATGLQMSSSFLPSDNNRLPGSVPAASSRRQPHSGSDFAGTSGTAPAAGLPLGGSNQMFLNQFLSSPADLFQTAGISGRNMGAFPTSSTSTGGNFRSGEDPDMVGSGNDNIMDNSSGARHES